MNILEANLSKFISANFAHVSLRITPYEQKYLVFESESEFDFLPNPMSLQNVGSLFVEVEHYEKDGYGYISYHLLDSNDKNFQLDIITIEEYIELCKKYIESYNQYVGSSNDLFGCPIV